jgi:heat shock protein HslJ
MKGAGRIARLLIASTVVTLALSACLPFPPVIRGPESTRSVFAPAVIQPGADVSPLRPVALPSAAATSEAGAPATRTDASAGTASGATDTTAAQGPVWQWTGSNFTDGSTLTPDDPARYTIEFLPDGNALVQADCNFGTGLYKEEGERLTIGAIGATKVACPPDSLDSAFLAQLAKVARLSLNGDELTLILQDDAGEMRLRAQPGTMKPTATAPARTPTAAVPPTATAAPVATATAAPTPTRTQLPAPATEPPPAPPTPTPADVFSATPAPTATPAGVEVRSRTWLLRALIVGGEKRPAMGETPATLEISPDGQRAAGSTGCNEYRSGVTVREDSIAFSGPALLTRTACDWPVLLQEVALFDALLRATSYQFADGLLILAGADGETLAEFAGK